MKIAADVLIFDPDAAIGIIESAVKGRNGSDKGFCIRGAIVLGLVIELKHRTKIE